MHGIYLDHNATSPLLPEALAAMGPWLAGQFGNASSQHAAGRRARQAVEEARAQVARLLGARPDEIVFTSGGTEGDVAALLGLTSRGDHVVTSAVEHPAVLRATERLSARGGRCTILPVDGEGRVDPEAVRLALRPETRLVSIMAANNETGVLQPVEAVGRIAAEAGVLFHTDAVQAAGKVPLDVARLRCHALTLSAHKMGGPQGVGALYLRRGTALRPLLVGGGQEHGKRAGTENVAGVVGLGAAAAEAERWLAGRGPGELAARRDRIERGLTERVPRCRPNGGRAVRVPNTANLSFECVSARALVVALDEQGIQVSSGSACAATSSEPPHVLLAMGLPAELAHAAVRFSLGKQSSDEEVAAVLDRVPVAVARLRSLSPLWAGLPTAAGR